MPFGENQIETEEPFQWTSHLKYSLRYSGWYQAALYKCCPSLYIKGLENYAQNGRMSVFISILFWSKHMYFQRPKDSIK